MQTRISLDFNVDGITKVIQETNKLEKKFEAVGDKISSQSNKVKNLVSSVKELNALLNGKSELGGAGNVEAFSESVQSSLLQAIEMAKQLQTALNNINVPAEIAGGLNTIVDTGNKVINSSALSYSKSDMQAYEKMVNQKSVSTSKQSSISALEKQIVSYADTLDDISGKYKNGFDDLLKVSPNNIKDVAAYGQALSKIEGYMDRYVSLTTKAKKGLNLSDLDNKYQVFGENFEAGKLNISRDLKYAFSQYGRFSDYNNLKNFQEELSENNKNLPKSADIKVKATPTVDTKEAEKQAENSAPIKVTVDKDALVNDITTAVQSKEYTINVKPQQNIADDISKQLEGKVANINIVAGASKGVASVNSQISDFQSAYDKYVGIVNSGKGSTASLLKQYPLLSDYKKGMDVEKTKSELTGKFANQITSGSSEQIKQLSESLNTLTEASGGAEKVTESFNAIRNSAQSILPPDFDEKILNLIDGLELLESHLAKSDIGSSPFIKTINELLSKGDELKALASVLADAQKGASKSLAKEATKEEKIVRANQSDINTVWNSSVGQMSYSGIEQAIIERSALRGKDITDMDQLRKDIALNLTKQGSIKNAEQMYDKLAESKAKINNIHINEDDEAESFERATRWVLRYREALDEVVKSPTKANLNRVAFAEAAANKYFDRSTGLQDIYAKSTQVNKIRDSVSKDINQNPKMPRDLAERYRIMQQAMEATYDKEGNKVAVTTEQYNEMQAVYSNLRAEMQATGQVGNNLFTKLGTGLGARIVQFTSFYLSFYRVVQYMRQGIETLEQFNTTLTKISYTMNVSDATLKEMGDSMQTIASDLSAPLENVEKIYTVYANMKTNPKEVEELTKYTTILSNLAGIDASAAADDVQGVIQQFGLASEDTAHIVDAFNYISANIAVDYSKGIEGLSEAVQGSGNVAKMAGLSFEQYGSIIAKVMEQTRMDGSRISNALRTIMTRLSKASTMDETVDNSTLSKASEALDKIGIQVYTTSGEYREFDTIMTELAAKWDGLTDAQRENISFAIAATRQTAMLKAVLNNWTDSMDLATEATNDNGSALENQEKYAKSYAARIQKIKTGLQNFAVDFLDNDVFSGAIEVVKALTSALEGLGGALGQLGVLGGIFAARSTLSQKGAINPFLTYNPYAAEGESKFNVQKPFSLTTRKAVEAYNTGLFQDVKKYQAAMKLGDYEGPNSSYYNTAAESISHYNAEQRIMIAQQTKAGYTAEEIAGGMRKISTGAKIASKATSIFSSVLTGLLTGAIIAAIGWVIGKLSEMSERAKELNDTVKSYNDTTKTDKKQYNDSLKKIRGLDAEFKTLSNGVSDSGENISLTTDEFNRYHEIANQVAELTPNLVSGYDEQGNAIVRLTDKYKNLTEAYQDAYLEQQRQQYYSSEGVSNTKDIIENMGNQYKPYEDTDETLDFLGPLGDTIGWLLKTTHYFGFEDQMSGSAQRTYDTFSKYLKMSDEDAAKQIEKDYDSGYLSIDEYNQLIDDEGKFNRENAQSAVNNVKAKIENAREGVRNSIIAAIGASTDISNATILFLQSVISTMDGAYFEGVETEEDYNNKIAELKEKFKDFTDQDRAKFVKLKSVGTGANDVKDYDKNIKYFAEKLGYGDDTARFAKDYGLEDEKKYNTVLSRIYQRLTAAGMSESNIQALLKKYGVNNLSSAQDFEKMLDKYTPNEWNNGTQTVVGAGAPTVNAEGVSSEVNDKFYKRVKGFDFLKEWETLGGNESGQKTQQALLDLANAGQLTIDTFKNAEGADAWLKSIGMSAEDVIPKINKLADSAKQLATLSSGVKSIREAYGEKRDEGVVGADTLSSMSETFGKLDYWKKYEEIVGTKSSSASQVKAASDKLLTEYVDSADYLAKLTNDNKQYYIDQLSDMGVANAVEVVNEKLAQQKTIIDDIQNSNTGKNTFEGLSQGAQDAAYNFTSLQNATDDEITELLGLSGISELTRSYLIKLQLTKLDWDNLNAEDAISKMKAIAVSAGVAVEKIGHLAKAEQYLNRAESDRQTAKDIQADIDAGKYDNNEDIKQAMQGQVSAWNKSADKWDTKAKRQAKLGTKTITKKLNKDIDQATNISMSTSGIDSKNGKGKSGKDGSDKNTKQQFDWLERRVTVITSKVDLLKSKLENLFSMKKKQSNLSKQIKEQTRLLKTYNKQVDIYGKKAAAVGLSSNLKKKIRNGQLKGTKAQLIQKYGEKTANKIEKYQDWYDKKQTAKKNRQDAIAARRQLKIDKQQLYVDKYNAQAEYKDLASTSGSLTADKRNALLTQEYDILKKSYKHQIKIAKINHDYTQVSKLELELANKRVELEKKKFDNVATQYDRLLKIMGYGIDKIESSISIIEARGAKANVNQFRAEAQGYSDQGALLDLEIAALKKRLSTIQKGTSEWYEANDELNSKVKERAETEVKQIEMMNKVREAYTDLYTAIEAQIERINTEQSFARDLTSDYEYFDFDTGVITDMGKAYSSSLMTSMYASQENLANDKERLKELQSFLNPNGTVNEAGQRRGYQSVDVLLDDIDAVFDMEQKHIKEIADQRANLAKFVEDSLKKEEDLLKKLIDKRKEELDAAKDLHDYQKSIQEKTNNINDIQRQISAYRGDTSQEGMSKLQQLQQQLLEAQDDLQETEYDKYISDQKQMLDNLYADYQDLLEAKLSEFENLVNDGFNMVAQYSEEGNALMDAFLQGLGYDIQYNDNGSKRQTSVTVSNLEEMRKRLSGTQGDNGSVPDANKSKETAKKSVQQTKEDYWKSIYNKQTVKQAGDVFAHRLVKGKYKTADEYKTSINRHLFKANGGKVLSNDGLERMRVVLGIGDNSEMLEILQWLSKNIGNIPHVKGFAKGGMVGDVVRRNGDDGFATLKVGEAVLTPVEAQQFKKLVTALPSLNNLTSELNSIKDRDIGLQSSNTFGDTYIDINLPNVENSTDFLNAIKNDDKIQKALQDVTVNRLNGGSRLGVKKIR